MAGDPAPTLCHFPALCPARDLLGTATVGMHVPQHSEPCSLSDSIDGHTMPVLYNAQIFSWKHREIIFLIASIIPQRSLRDSSEAKHSVREGAQRSRHSAVPTRTRAQGI